MKQEVETRNLCKILQSSRKSYTDDLNKKKKITKENERKILASKKHFCDKIPAMEKPSRLKHKKIKNKKL